MYLRHVTIPVATQYVCFYFPLGTGTATNVTSRKTTVSEGGAKPAPVKLADDPREEGKDG